MDDAVVVPPAIFRAAPGVRLSCAIFSLSPARAGHISFFGGEASRARSSALRWGWGDSFAHRAALLDPLFSFACIAAPSWTVLARPWPDFETLHGALLPVSSSVFSQVSLPFRCGGAVPQFLFEVKV